MGNKFAIITDLDGYMTDTTLVADNVTGVFPILQPVPKTEEVETLTVDDPEEPEEPTEPEMITVAYTVAVKPPEGLYKLRYDLDAYHAAMEQYERDLDDWRDEMKRQAEEAVEGEEIEYLPPPAAPDLSKFWTEGYTQEELEELLNPPPGPPTPTQRIEALEEESINTMIGLTEVYETTAIKDADRETENINTMIALTEVYELVSTQQATIDALTARLEALEGGES